MKTAFGLWFGLALSLLAARAGAQLDSNAYLSIPEFCGSCSYSITEVYRDINTHKISSDTLLENESLCDSFVGSVPSQNDSAFVLDTQYFQNEFNESIKIDTAKRIVESLRLFHLWNSYLNFDQNAVLSIDLILAFDSLPVVDSAGIYISRGLYSCHYEFSSGVTTLPNTEGYSAYGSCGHSGDTL